MKKLWGWVCRNEGAIFFGLIMGGMVIAFVAFVIAINKQRRQEIEADRRASVFYAQHNCKPEGYLPAKYEPVRTYRCDNGLFIKRDMQ